MKLQKLILATALGLCSVGAFADWQPYVGGGVGVTSGVFTTNINNPALLSNAPGGSGYTDSTKGPYNFSNTSNMMTPEIQFGISNQYNKFYLGFEASLQYNSLTSTSHSITDTVTTGPLTAAIFNSQVVSTLHWNSSLTTQLGYFVTQNLMPYAKVGVTAAQGNVAENINAMAGSSAPSTGLAASTQAYPWMVGPTVSLGAQYTLTQHLRAFGQVNYTYLWGSASPGLSYTPVGNQWVNLTSAAPKQKYTYSAWTLEVGTNYYF